MQKIRLILIAITLTTLSACSSAPPIPEESETPQYESTQSDAATKSEGSNAEEEALATPTQPVRATGPVATVDGQPIPADAFNKVIDILVARGASAQQINSMKESIVNGVVDDFLIQQKVSSLNYDVPKDVYQQRFDELKALVQQRAPVPEDQIEEVLAEQIGIKPAELKEQLEQAIRLEIELEKEGYLEPVSKEAIQKFYDENPQISDAPELVTASHILIKVDEGASDEEVEAKRKEALEIAKLARKKGADFAKLAEEKSEGPTAKNGGRLGKISKGLMVPEFEEAVFKLKPNKISDPVRTQFGWHVIRVEKHEKARKIPLKELESKIENRIRRLQTSEVLVKYLTDLRAKKKIDLHLENLK